MKTYHYYQVDAFTDEKFHGNPAGVVIDADGLTAHQMQQIAREMNNSETAFVFSPRTQGGVKASASDAAAQDTSQDGSEAKARAAEAPYDIEVRFFTPENEVPICGHNTIAVHYVRAMCDHITGRTLQKTGAGILPVDISWNGDVPTIAMTQGKPEFGTPFSADTISEIADALGISADDIRPDCPVGVASTGHAKVMVGIFSTDKLNHLIPSMEKLAYISHKIGCSGYYVFTLSKAACSKGAHSEDVHPLVYGRMFSPAIGVNEDPVTGNANGSLGAYLVHYGIVPELETADHLSFSIVQGEAIGRRGTMDVHVQIENGEPTRVQIFGHAALVFKAEITL